MASQDSSLRDILLRRTEAAFARGGWIAANKALNISLAAEVEAYADDEHINAITRAELALLRALESKPLACRAFLYVGGMGALLGRDGTFVLGVMGLDTANAGRIYFPSGTPDPHDIRNGMLDLEGSVVRELEEETGLTPADYRYDAGWHCVHAGMSVAIIKVVHGPGDSYLQLHDQSASPARGFIDPVREQRSGGGYSRDDGWRA